MPNNWKIEGNRVIIEFNPDSKVLSKSQKSYMLATSNGFQHDSETGIDVSFNITKRK